MCAKSEAGMTISWKLRLFMKVFKFMSFWLCKIIMSLNIYCADELYS